MGKLEYVLTRSKTKAPLIFSGAATLIICCVMNFVLIPMIERSTQGLRVFDMNPFGCGVQTANEFLSLLSEQGRGVYLHVQLPLDFVYPVFYSWFFTLSLGRLTGRLSPLIALPSLLAVTDYIENAFTLIMLRRMTATEALARTASLATTAKTVLMVVCFISIIVCLALYLVRRRKTSAGR